MLCARTPGALKAQFPTTFWALHDFAEKEYPNIIISSTQSKLSKAPVWRGNQSEESELKGGQH